MTEEKPVDEEVLEPDLPICDAHHHLWDLPDNRYLANDLLGDIGGHNVSKTVFVEAWGMGQHHGSTMKDPSEQTALAAAEASRDNGRTDVAAGIVGYADLMAGSAVAPIIEAHIAAGNNRLRGIRLAGSSVFSDDKFNEGFPVLIRHNLTVDAFVKDRQLLELGALANRYPDTPIIINHLGLLPIRHRNQKHDIENEKRVVEKWKETVSSLAVCPNLFMKLGGFGMDLSGAGWERPDQPGSAELAEIISPLYTYCIEKFGVDRCLFESNFPVDKRAFSYNTLWNAHKLFSKSFSDSQRCALFYGTAVTAYRL